MQLKVILKAGTTVYKGQSGNEVLRIIQSDEEVTINFRMGSRYYIDKGGWVNAGTWTEVK